MHRSKLVVLGAFVCAFACAFACALTSSVAFAEEGKAEKADKAEKGTITLDVIKIKGRPAHPNVAVDVARLVPRAPLPELKQPLLQRIGAAVERDPF